MPKLLHEVEEARAQLSIGRTRFYQEVRAGRLLLVKSGGKSLVPDESLKVYVERLIAEAAQAPASPPRRKSRR